MRKKIISAILILTTFFPCIVALALPEICFMFYDESVDALYVFGKYDKLENGASDAGIYMNGKKYSYVKDGNTKNLDNSNKMTNPQFGIALMADRNYLDNAKLYPYAEYGNGLSMTGDTVTYDSGKTAVVAPRTLLYEDFTSYKENEKPTTIKLTEQADTSATLVRAETEDGTEKTMVRFIDNSATKLAMLDIVIPDYSGTVTLEMKFKALRTTTDGFGMIMNFFDANSKNAFRMAKFTGANDGLSYINSSGTIPFTGGVNFHDEWFVLKIQMNNDLKNTSVMIENDGFKTDYSSSVGRYNYIWQDLINGQMFAYNQPWFNDYKGGDIKKITISTYGSSHGEYYIDYIRLTENAPVIAPKRVRAPSKSYETIPDPKPRF